MSNALLRLRLAYNKWYLGQLKYSNTADLSGKIKAIREQVSLIQNLEQLINENRKPQN